MFKASFPWAEIADEEKERKYIKGLESTSSEETAGNIWIPPHHALELAEEYKILPWIKALLDNKPINTTSSKDATPKSISPPPKYTVLPQDLAPQPTPSRGRTRRSVSPSKIASPRKPTAARARKAAAKAAEAAETTPVKAVSKDTKEAQKAAEDSPAVSDTKEESTKLEATKLEATKEEPTKEEAVVRVNVDTDVEVKGDVEVTHTHVEVEMPAGLPELPMPDNTEALIAQAKEMVEAAVKSSGAEPSNPKKKRKAEEVEKEEDDEAVEEAGPSKKAKVEVPAKKIELTLRSEKVKTRALIGLSATLAIG